MRLAVIGTGAIFRTLHAPALARQPDVTVDWLIDTDRRRLEETRLLFPNARTAASLEHVQDVEAVLITTPNTLHASQAREALQRRVHVLVEKPLALTAADALTLSQTAELQKLACCVNVNRRFLPNVVALKQLSQSGDLGRPLRFAVSDGVRSVGPAEGGVHYQGLRELAGGGVLADTGSHMLDLPLYLINAHSTSSIEYCDDGTTGLEAECKFVFEATADFGQVTIRGFLSRISPAPQSIAVDFEDATVTTLLSPPGDLFVQFHKRGSLSTVIPVAIPADVFLQTFRDSQRAFIDAAKDGSQRAEHSAASALLTVETIERCYAVRKPMHHPWKRSHAPSRHALGGTRIGIIGAGGFLGSRLYEMAAENGAVPKAIGHSTQGSFALLRHTSDIATGDASHADFLIRNLRGCDTVVNCAINMKGGRRFAIRATRDIGRSVARVCGQLGIKRLVHISTIAVHGTFLGRNGNEPGDDPLQSAYAAAKLASEHDVLHECSRNGTEAVILRLGHLYGPYAAGWTAGQYKLVQERRLIRVEGWRNPSNTLFVDNAVAAIFAAITASAGAGRTFYITDYPNQTWHQFYEPLFRLAGRQPEELPDWTYEQFASIFRLYTRSPVTQALQLSQQLAARMADREFLKSARHDPRFTRFFETLQSWSPPMLFDALTNTAKRRAPQVTSSDDIASVFTYLCSYASSARIPVIDAVEALEYRPEESSDLRAESTMAWLRFVNNP